MRLGAIIGRFQVPELHEGHITLIEHVREQFGQAMILLGVTPVLGSKRNPLDYATREKMIKDRFPDVIVAPIADMHSDEAWSQNLDATVRLVNPIGEVVLYGGRDSFIPHYRGKLKTVEIELGFSQSGTDLRRLASNRIRISSDFRAGVIYATANQWPRVFPTVDIAIIQDNQLLLGKKPNQDLFVFPGGFVDQEDSCLEESAAREAQEETGMICTTLQYVMSNRNSDWRYKHKDDGLVMTTLFACFDATGQPKASDDLDSLHWFHLDTLTPDRLVPTHRPLLVALQDKLGKLGLPKGEIHG